MSTVRTNLLAEEIARAAHEGQKRWSGQPYITHPEAMVKALKEKYEFHSDVHDIMAIAWLHDVLEDTDVTAQDLLDKGIHKDVVFSVIALTKKPNEEYLYYLDRIINDIYAPTVKMADLEHNLSDLKKGTRRDKYMLAHYIIKGYMSSFLASSAPVTNKDFTE